MDFVSDTYVYSFHSCNTNQDLKKKKKKVKSHETSLSTQLNTKSGKNKIKYIQQQFTKHSITDYANEIFKYCQRIQLHKLEILSHHTSCDT